MWPAVIMRAVMRGARNPQTQAQGQGQAQAGGRRLEQQRQGRVSRVSLTTRTMGTNTTATEHEEEEGKQLKDAGDAGDAGDVGMVLRSTQSAHELLRCYYVGQTKGKEILVSHKGVKLPPLPPLPPTKPTKGDEHVEGEGEEEEVELEFTTLTSSARVAREQGLMRWYEEDMPRLRVRPTVLRPLVQAVGFTGGLLATLLAPENVQRTARRTLEDAFTEHINDQLRELHEQSLKHSPPGEGEGEGEREREEDSKNEIMRLKSKLVEARDAEREPWSEEGVDSESDEEEQQQDQEPAGDLLEVFQKQFMTTENVFKTSIQMGYRTIVDHTKKY